MAAVKEAAALTIAIIAAPVAFSATATVEIYYIYLGTQCSYLEYIWITPLNKLHYILPIPTKLDDEVLQVAKSTFLHLFQRLACIQQQWNLSPVAYTHLTSVCT